MDLIAMKTGPYAVEYAERPSPVLSLSICMIVRDEEENLPFCLESVRPLADEVVVVDTGSRDRTPEIAARFGAKLYSFPWNGSFADCRNFSLSMATGDWILVLDADEVLSPRDCPSMRLQINQCREATAFSVPIRNYSNKVNLLGWQANCGSFSGEERGTGWYPSEMIRLFPNDRRIRFEAQVHETVRPSLERLGYRIASSVAVVHHYGKLNETRDAAKWQLYYDLGRKKLLSQPVTPEAMTELAIQAGELRRFDEAIELWEMALALCPDYAEGHLNLGCCLEMAGRRYDQALTRARRALELKPDLKEALFNCAKYEMYIGDIERSVELICKLLANEPEYPPALALFAALLIAKDQEAQSWPLLARLSKAGYDCVGFLDGHAEILWGLDKSGAAERLERAKIFAASMNNGSACASWSG